MRSSGRSASFAVCPPLNFAVMRLKTAPFTPIVGIDGGSDIESVSFDGAGLVIKVAREIDDSDQVKGMEIVFAKKSSFRYLDEGDLARYWVSDGFQRGSLVLEVLEGGWSYEENQLQGYDSQRREWLIVTGNGCVSVFCSVAPEVRDVSWAHDA